MDTFFPMSVCGFFVILSMGCQSNPSPGVGAESVFMTELRALEAVIDFSDVQLSRHGWASVEGRDWEYFFRIEWKAWSSVHAYLYSTYSLETWAQIVFVLTSLKLLSESANTNEDELISYFMANWDGPTRDPTPIIRPHPDDIKLIKDTPPATQPR